MPHGTGRSAGDGVVYVTRAAASKPKKTTKQYELVETTTPRDALRPRDTALPASHTGGAARDELPRYHQHRSDGIDAGEESEESERIQINHDEDNDDGTIASIDDSDSTGTTTASPRKATRNPLKPTSTSTNTTHSAVHQIPCTQIAVVALSAISGFLFGYDLCVMVIALPLIHEAFDLSTEMAEAVISILMVGAVFGSLAGGVVADRIGRKRAMIATSVFFLLGSLCMTFADSISVMLLGRFLAGLAVGSSGPCVSSYVAEIADPEHRGVLVTVNEVMLCVGCLVSVLVSSSLQDTVDGWRRMLGVTLLPPLVQLAGMPFVPESPRWLITQKDRAQEARLVLQRLIPGRDANETDAQIKTQLANKALSTSLGDALRHIASDGITRRRVVLSLLVALAHTLTGANAMLYYSSYIIDSLGSGVAGGDSGLGETTSSSLSGVSKELGVAIAKLAGVCTAIVIVDRVGRRSLLLVGSIVMLSADLVFAYCTWGLESAGGSRHPSDETVGIWSLYVFIYAWNFSWAPLMWVICSELLPDDLRSVGMGLTFAVYWLGSSLVNQTLLSIFQLCGMSASFLVYGSFTTAAIAFIYWKVPETRGLSFEEITMQFTKSP